jgi:hypothetical protein
MIYEIPVYTGILTRGSRNVENILQNSHVCLKWISALNKLIVGKINSGKFRPESGGIQFPVPVRPEPEQGYEFPVPDQP